MNSSMFLAGEKKTSKNKNKKPCKSINNQIKCLWLLSDEDSLHLILLISVTIDAILLKYYKNPILYHASFVWLCSIAQMKESMPEWSLKQTKQNYEVIEKASDFSVLSGSSRKMNSLSYHLHKKNFIHTSTQKSWDM